MYYDFNELLDHLSNIETLPDETDLESSSFNIFNDLIRNILVKGIQEFNNLKPHWAKAAIVAKYEVDESDISVGLFCIRTKKVVLLSWSDNEENNFQELKKAASKYQSTAHLAKRGAKSEIKGYHFGGTGYSLKDGNQYTTGWRVQKETLGIATIKQLYIALANHDHVLPQNDVPNSLDSNKNSIIKLEKYSDKSIVVRGMPTKNEREKLKSIGGRFNWGLKGGPGWIFPLKKIDEVKNILKVKTNIN